MWMLPTVSRPGNFVRAIETYPKVDVLAIFTENDPLLDEVEGLELPQAWRKFTGPPDSTVPELLNLAFAEYPGEKTYGFIGDDVVPPKDIRWDLMLQHAADSIFFAYPTDSVHKLRGAPHFCIGGDLVRAAGWLAAPWFSHNFIDTTWYYLAKELYLRRPVPDVEFEHMHPLDQQYLKLDDEIYRKGRASYAEDERVFKKWMTAEGIGKKVQSIQESLNAI